MPKKSEQKKTDIEEIEPCQDDADKELSEIAINRHLDQLVPQHESLDVNPEAMLFQNRENFNFQSIYYKAMGSQMTEEHSCEQSFDFAQKGYPDGSSLDDEPGDLISDSSFEDEILSDEQDIESQLAIEESLKFLSLQDKVSVIHPSQVYDSLEISKNQDKARVIPSLEVAKCNESRNWHNYEYSTDDDIEMRDAESKSPKNSPRDPSTDSTDKNFLKNTPDSHR
jgi:hypothetical protein